MKGFYQKNKANKGDIRMSKYENDPQYEHKFFVVKDSIIQQELDFLRGQESVAYHNVLHFLNNVANRAKDKEYLVINQDEPYADKVWELIKQGENLQKISECEVENE